MNVIKQFCLKQIMVIKRDNLTGMLTGNMMIDTKGFAEVDASAAGEYLIIMTMINRTSRQGSGNQQTDYTRAAKIKTNPVLRTRTKGLVLTGI